MFYVFVRFFMVSVRIISGLKDLVPLSRRLHYVLTLDTKTDCFGSTRPTLVDIIYIETRPSNLHLIIFCLSFPRLKAIALAIQASLYCILIHRANPSLSWRITAILPDYHHVLILSIPHRIQSSQL